MEKKLFVIFLFISIFFLVQANRLYSVIVCGKTQLPISGESFDLPSLMLFFHYQMFLMEII